MRQVTQRLGWPSVSHFKHQIAGQRPVVFKNSWTCRGTNKWQDPDYLQDLAGIESVVTVEVGEGAYSAKSKIMCGLDEGSAYLAQTPLSELSPVLLEDVQLPDWDFAEVWGEQTVEPMIWLGKGSISPLHWDIQHNFLVQVRGSKYVRLFDPSSPHIYPHSGWSMRHTSQIVDIHDQSNNDIKFPGFNSMEYCACWLDAGGAYTEPSRLTVLRLGDVLYIPPRWWHYISSCTTTNYQISLNYWWS